VKYLLAIVLGLVPSIMTAQEPSAAATPSPAQTPQTIRLGGAVAAAKLVHRVQAMYPPLARQARISGTVRLDAIIGRDGTVKQLTVLSGHPLLVPAALDAVRQWEYQPTTLNGEPVAVETTIDVIFALQDSRAGRGSLPGTLQAPGGPKEVKILRSPPVDAALRADLLRLMDLLGITDRSIEASRKAMEPMRAMMFRTILDEGKRRQVVAEYEGKLAEIFKSEDFREGVIATYAKYFDDDDAKALISFFDSPAGRKYNDAMPGFQADMIELRQRLAMGRVPSALEELCQEHPELSRQLPGCAPSDQPKKSELSPALPQGTTQSADR